MKQAGKRACAAALSATFLFASKAALAASSSSAGLFSHPPETDLALGWMSYLFRGTKLPSALADGGAHFADVATALRYALNFYSLGMMVLAGIILLYHALSLVAETAHQGVPFGRRANQIWAPIRLVLAFTLLLPIGSGLNAGQFLVVKFAEAGSAMASNAWRTTANSLKDHFSTLAVPTVPNVTRLAATAVEMESCKSLYNQLFVPVATDPAAKQAGNIIVIAKNAPQRFAPETWVYTNALHETLPLCGSYRFALDTPNGASRALPHEMQGFFAGLASFSRTMTDDLISQTRLLASATTTAVPNGGTPSVTLSNDLAPLVATQQKNLNAKLKTFLNNSTPLVAASLEQSAQAGWVAAGLFTVELTRLQTLYGVLASAALPSAQAPLFGHRVLSRQFLTDAIGAHPALAGQKLEHLSAFYFQMNAAMRQARTYIYRQIPYAELIPPDQFDLEDHLTATTDQNAGFFLLNRAMNAAAFANGLWNESFDRKQDEAVTPTATTDETPNPIARLAEFGKNQLALGVYLFGMATSAFGTEGVFGSALLFAGFAVGFILGGCALLFLISFLPFLRFLIAVLAWLLAVFEAMAALPLIALAHLTPAGEGLSGPTARKAYWLWLAVFMRPILTFFGFMVGWLLLTYAVSFLDLLFGATSQTAFLLRGELFAPLRAALVFFHTLLLCAAVNAAFKGINGLPDGILNWLSPAIATESANVPPPAAQTTVTNAPLPLTPPHFGTKLGTPQIRKAAPSAPAENTSNAGYTSPKTALFPQVPEKTDLVATTPATDKAAKEPTRDVSLNIGKDVYAADAPRPASFAPQETRPLNNPSAKDILNAVSALDTFVRAKEAEKDSEKKAEDIDQKKAEKTDEEKKTSPEQESRRDDDKDLS